MSLRKSLSVRSDIHDAVSNILSNPRDSDPLDARRSEYIHLSVQQAFKIFGELNKFEANRASELHKDINIACFIGLPLDVRPEQSYPFDAKLSGKIRWFSRSISIIFSLVSITASSVKCA
jgi:hypothetical protein